MCDLEIVLPRFDTAPWRFLLHSIEKKGITTTELLSSEAIEISRRCPLPLKELSKLIQVIVKETQVAMPFLSQASCLGEAVNHDIDEDGHRAKRARISPHSEDIISSKTASVSVFQVQSSFIPILTPALDSLLGGGIATRGITEIVGESAAGKTQFAMSLLLSSQLPLHNVFEGETPSQERRPAIYVCTESNLKTRRLQQMLDSHPYYRSLADDEKPNLDNVYTVEAKSFEVFESVMLDRLPIMVERLNPAVVVIDSIAANFRSDFQDFSKRGIAERAQYLLRIGTMLRNLAIQYNMAVVCTNQVSDRFDDGKLGQLKNLNSSFGPSQTQDDISQRPAPTPRTAIGEQDEQYRIRRAEAMSLDVQQNYFSGWGDVENDLSGEKLKTPALGLTWANQLTTRLALKVVHRHSDVSQGTGNLYSDLERKRCLSIVFSPYAECGNRIAYDIEAQGIVVIEEKKKNNRSQADRAWDFEIDEKLLDREEKDRRDELQQEIETKQAQVAAQRKAEDMKVRQQDEMKRLLDPSLWQPDEDEEFS